MIDIKCPQAINRHALASRIRREACYWNDLSWALDSAMSGQRKASVVGYRSGENGVSAATGHYQPGGITLDAASDEAYAALRAIGKEHTI
jgi:hypothetical protein